MLRFASLLLAAFASLSTSPSASPQDLPWSPEEAQELERAQELLRTNDAAGALRIFDTLLQNHEANGALHRMRGHALVDLERDTQAREAFLQALQHGELTSDVFARLMEIDYRSGRSTAMLASTEFLVLLDPERRDWKRLYADLLLTSGEPAASRVVLNDLLERDYANPELHERLSRVAQQLGETELAVKELELAYHLGQRDASTMRRLESLCLACGEAGEALGWSVANNESDPSAVIRRAEMSLSLGDENRAHELATGLLAAADAQLEEGVRSRARNVLGRVALARGDVDAAVDQWRQATSLSTTNPQLARYIGARLFDRGEFEAARRFLELGLDGTSSARAACELFAACHLEEGNAAPARAAILDYLKAYGPDAPIEVLIKRLRSLESGASAR